MVKVFIVMFHKFIKTDISLSVPFARKCDSLESTKLPEVYLFTWPIKAIVLKELFYHVSQCVRKLKNINFWSGKMLQDVSFSESSLQATYVCSLVSEVDATGLSLGY